MKILNTLFVLLLSHFIFAQNCPEGIIITRVSGEGAGGNFLNISKNERNRLLAEQDGGSPDQPSAYNGKIDYCPDQAPIQVKALPGQTLVAGDYTLYVLDQEGLGENEVGWKLFKDGNFLTEYDPITAIDFEQIIEGHGFSIKALQTTDAGDTSQEKNGAIDQTIHYDDPSKAWLKAIYSGLDEFMFDIDFLADEPTDPQNSMDPNKVFSKFGSAHFSPFVLCDYEDQDVGPAWMNTGMDLVVIQNPLEFLNNVDVVFTNDKSKWSRCVVVETATPAYYSPDGIGLVTLGEGENFDLRQDESVGKEDSDGDDKADEDGTGTGMSWFPGYAIDVETGTRLNIFFGENTTYSDLTPFPNLIKGRDIGGDMMWNPSDQNHLDIGSNSSYGKILGGQHYIYVSLTPYDECAFIYEKLSQNSVLRNLEAINKISWTAVPLLEEGLELNSYNEGLIPTETVVKLRVNNPYQPVLVDNFTSNTPTYEFTLGESTAVETFSEKKLKLIPNPSSDKFSIQGIAEFEGEINVEIFDHLGRSVLSQRNVKDVEISDLAPGLYQVILQTKDWMAADKLIVR